MKSYSFTIPKASLTNPGIISLDIQYIKGHKIFNITPNQNAPKDPNQIIPAITILTGDLNSPVNSYNGSNVDKAVFSVKEKEDSDFEIMSVKPKSPTKFHNGIIIDRFYLNNGIQKKYYGQETFYGYVCIRDGNCQPPSSENYNMYFGVHSESENKITKSQFLCYAKLQGNNPGPTNNPLHRVSCYGATVNSFEPTKVDNKYQPSKQKRSYFYTAMMQDHRVPFEGDPGVNVFSIFCDEVNDSGLSDKVKPSEALLTPSANAYISGFLYGGRASIRKFLNSTYYGETDFSKRAGIDWLTDDIPGIALNRIKDGTIALFSKGVLNDSQSIIGTIDISLIYGLRVSTIITDQTQNDRKNYENRDNKRIMNGIWNIFNKIKTYRFIKNESNDLSSDNYTYNFFPDEVLNNFKQAHVPVKDSNGKIQNTGVAYAEFIPLIWEAVNDINVRLKKLEAKNGG